MKITIIIRKWCATLLLMALPLLSWSAPYYIDHEGFSYYGVIGRELSVIGCSLSGDVVVPSKIICNDLEYDVTAISGGFTDHQDLTSVTISNGITVIGTSAFSGCSNLREVNLPSTSLVEIGSSAFSKCLSLKSITIPNSVETIWNGAFSGSGLTSISIPNSVTKIEGAFMDCADLASVKIGSGLTTIGASTFQNCTSLSSITIPKNITRIEGSAFSGCSGLVTMTIPESVTYIGTSVFQDCTGRLNINCNIPGPVHYDLGVFYGAKFTELVMGDSVKSIGWNAFGYDGNTFLTSVTFGKNVETIGNNAFSGCSSLTSITIPNSVKTIGNQVFFRCTGLKTVTIGSGLETMGGGVFQECTALQSASIRSGSIGSSAFASCTNLVNLTLGDGVTSIGSSAFNSCSSLSVVDIPSSVNSIGSTAFYECSGLTSFTIPNSVTSIGEWAFGYCTGKAYINRNITTNNGNPYAGARFTEVVVGDGVTEIGDGAFQEMGTLTSLSLPDGLLTIGNNAFFGCNELTSVKIPASVTNIGFRAFCNSKKMNLAPGSLLSCEIGNEAFAGCTKLTAVTFGPNVGNIGTSAFARCEALASVTVPNGVTKMKTIGQYAFSECSQMGAFDFPSCVDSIGYGAFEKCYSLTLVNLPEGLRTIEGSAFFGCSGVTSVTIPKSVQTMGSNIFNGCQGTAYIYCNLPGYSEWSSPFTAARFSSIVLGENVTEISDWIFYQCQQLRNVTVERTTPVEIGGAVFPYRSSSTLYCPNGGKYKYKEADYWKEFQNIVAPQYKLTYEVDGKVYKTDSIDFEAPLVAIEGPTKEGYTFSGWSEIPKTMPANDVVITGAFKVNKYLLTYKVDDEIVKSDSIVYNTTLTPEAEPTKDGYTFSGWSEIPATMPAQDVVVTGTFKVNKYLLTYKVDDEIFKSDSIVYNATINPETAPTKEGYTFSGWSEIPATMPAQDVVVTGTFKVNKYLLTYKVDDEIVKSDSIVYNTAITPEAEPTKEGYTFSGWSEIPETMPAEDVVVTGSFKINKYLLTYKVDNEVFKSDSIVYNSALTAIEAPTKEGYTFSGWSEIPETMPANDVIVTGSFSINKYLLTYKVDDEVVKSDSIVYNSSLTPIAEPIKEGYTFSGWSEMPSTMPAQDVLVTGTFKINKYLLTYKVDGEIVKSDSIVYNATITLEAEPTKEGYTFSGWSEIPSTMPAQDVVVTGTFKINKYLLTYKVDDELVKSDSIVYNTAITPEANPTKEGYTFSGWSEIPETMPAHDVEVSGSFKINKYLLTYKVDGEVFKSDSIVYNSSLTPIAEPTKEGYTFSGWSEIPSTMPAQDVVVTGTFKVNKYLLTYKVDDEIFKSDSIVYNATINPETAPTKEGYTFSGWSEIPETMPAQDVVVTGTFKINKYLLTYKVDDEIVKSDSIVYNTAITPEAEPTKEGYTFSGWSEIPETMPANDVVITGTFKVNKYLLTYKVDNEVFKSDSIVYNSALTAIEAPTKEGYTFSGWSEIPETMPANDVIVTGSFSINKYLLTYKVDDEVVKSDSIVYNTSLTAIAEPTKEGYTFSGWSWIPNKMPAEDVVVTGSFKANKYLLTYKVDNEIFKSDSIVFNSALTAIAEPTKEGYTFSGWSEIPDSMPAQDVLVTGTFKINKYLLTYKVDDEVFKSDSIVYNSSLTPIAEPIKEGYTFSGWSEIPATMPANDVVITGAFKVNKYLLTYKVDGEIVKSDSIVYNAAITPEAEPTKEGYTFSGWSEIPETMPAKDVVVTGTFKINKYLLTYKVDDEIVKSDSIVYNTAITPEAEPTKEGYTFSGWSEIPETMPAEDVIVTGTFKINKYLLTYKVDDEVFKSDSIVYNTAITPEANPTKEGYTFSGWSEIPETMPAKEVLVTGTFSINSYKLTYMIDDKVYKDTVYEYSATIVPEPMPEGNYVTFEWIDLPETMPAHDVVVHASYTTGIREMILAKPQDVQIYSPNGKKLNKLQKGLNIVVMSNGKTQKVVVK